MGLIFKRYWIFVVFIALSLIMPSLWFPRDYIYLSEEDNYSNYQNVIYRNSYSWTTKINMGNPVLSTDHIGILPMGLFYYALTKLHVPLDQIQRTYMSMVIFCTFLSIYAVLRLFTKNSLILLIGSLFYYLNFYVKSTPFYSPKMYQLILGPLFFYFYYQYLSTRKARYILFNFFSFFLFQSIFTNLATLMATLAAYPIAFAYYSLGERKDVLLLLRKTFPLSIVFFFPLIPIIVYNVLIYYFSYVSSNTFQSIKSTSTFTALGSQLQHVFQFRGAWWESASYEGVSYNPWFSFYENPFIVFISYSFIGLIGFAFFRRKVNKITIFWSVCFLLALLFATGSSFFPAFYEWFFQNVPLFYIFREPWAKFTPLVIFSLTILTVNILDLFRNKYLILLCLVFVLIRGIPFFSPNFYDQVAKRWYIPFMKLPPYWMEYESWTKTHQDKTLLMVPVNFFKRDWYMQDLGNIEHPLARLFGYSNIIYNLSNNYFGQLLTYFILHNNPNFVKIAPIDYALSQKDVTTDPRFYTPGNKLYNDSLLNYFQTNPVISFGNKLTILPIKNEYVVPKLYVPQENIVIGNIDEFSTLIAKSDYSYKTTFYLRGQNGIQITKLENFFHGNQPTASKLSYKKIDPTRYEITLTTPTATPLIFLENYHPDWEVYGKRDAKPVSKDTHLIANGYANAWIIDPASICKRIACVYESDGSYTMHLSVEYTPQRYLMAAQKLYIPFIGYLLAVIGVALYQFRKRSHA